MSVPRPKLAALCAIAASLAVSSASAQQGSGGPDIVDLALGWARGAFASPVVCRFDDKVERGIRRIVIAPGPRSVERRVDRINFVDLGASGGTRCLDELGAEEQNVVGTLFVTYTAKRPRSDTPQRDFDQEMKSGPLAFSIVSGKLRVGSATLPSESLPEVDFEGGKLLLGPVEHGSDDARRLSEFEGERRLRLDAESPSGVRFQMPLVEYERR